MQTWIINVLNQFGYIGIALLIAIENIFPPIPSEVILTFAGFMTTYTTMNIWMVTLFATIGSVAGALVLYGVGSLLSPERFDWLVDKCGRILHFKRQDIARAETWFARKGLVTVFFCRFIPVIRSLISIPAGMSHMKMGPFLVFTTIGTAIWNIVLVWLGAVAGAQWQNISNSFDTYSKITGLVLVAVAVVLAVIIVLHIRKKKNKACEQ